MFTSLAEAKEVIEEWRRDYNALRPYTSLGGMSPEEYGRAFNGENQKDQSPNLSLVYLQG
jgi:putative transposase